VPNMMVVMSVKETRTRNTSTPNGSSNVHPSFGIPRLLSSNRFPGASGSRDRRRPPPPAFFASASRSASSTLLPNSGFGGLDDADAAPTPGFDDAPFFAGSAYLPSTRAARRRSRAVSGARFGASLAALPLAPAGCCGWPLPGVTAFPSAALVPGAAAVSCVAVGAAWLLSVAGRMVLACLFLDGELNKRSSGGSFWKARLERNASCVEDEDPGAPSCAYVQAVKNHE
jgi:hypothetical protein